MATWPPATHQDVQDKITALRDMLVMAPGDASTELKRVSVVSVNGTVSPLTVAAGRKYVLKSIILGVPNTASAQTVTLSISGVSYLFYNQTLTPGVPVVMPMSVVLTATEFLNFTSNGVNATIEITYADMASTDSPVRLASSAGAAGTINTWTTVYTAPVDTVITNLVFTNIGASMNYAYRVGSVNIQGGFNTIGVNGFVNLTQPIFMAAGEVLQVIWDTASILSYTISGLPA